MIYAKPVTITLENLGRKAPAIESTRLPSRTIRVWMFRMIKEWLRRIRLSKCLRLLRD